MLDVAVDGCQKGSLILGNRPLVRMFCEIFKTIWQKTIETASFTHLYGMDPR